MNLLDKISRIYHIWSPHKDNLIPLYRGLFNLFRQHIQNGDLPSGFYVPSTRVLSKELGISRSTVNRVYELLIFEGLLESKIGKGYQIPKKVVDQSASSSDKLILTDQLSEVAHSFLNLPSNVESQNISSLSFRPGVPPLDIFPIRKWMSITQKYWKEIQYSSLNYKPTSGIHPLKETLSNYLRVDRNIHCDPEQIIVVSGSLQSLYLIANALINPTNSVQIENPSFQNVNSVFNGMRANLLPIEIDEFGAKIPDYVASNLKLTHLTPSCQYPLGIEMSLQRKLEWIEFAKNTNTFLVENDYEHEIVHYKRDIPTLFQLDTHKNTIYLATFNRILHPSIRIGYMVIPSRLVPAMEALMNHSHRFVSPATQFVLNEFIQLSYLQMHVKSVVQNATERKSAFIKTAKTLFPEWNVQETSALHLLVKLALDSSQSDITLSNKLLENEIVTHSLSNLYLNTPVEKGLILGYSSTPASVIQQKLNKWHAII